MRSLIPTTLCVVLIALTPRAEADVTILPPTVTSPFKVGITATTVTLGGWVANSGSYALVSRGIVYALTSVNPNPTVGGVGVTFVSETAYVTGRFTKPITGLTPSSNYSFAAYALNRGAGEAYSAVGIFSTLAPAVTHLLPPNGTMDGGTAVTLVGTGFTGATSVTIGGVAATSVTVIADGMINCTTGAHAAGTVNAVVTNGSTITGTGLYTYGALPIPAGESWTERTTSGQRYWRSIASSADGRNLAAVDGESGYIYTSTDAGATWTQQTASGQRQWLSIASSADGSKLAAVAYRGFSISTSTDGGATWTDQWKSGLEFFNDIASSADGSKLAAVAEGSYISTSVDGGVTWTRQTASGNRRWGSIVSSADGSKLAAAGGGYIYTSTDAGATWTQQTGAGAGTHSIASSADGSKLATVDAIGYISTSTDGGATWTPQTASGQHSWNAIASSADGSKLAAVTDHGYISTSTDGGATWTQQTGSGQRFWKSIASSADGSKLAATEVNGYIYTSVGLPSPPVATAPKAQPVLNKRTGLYEWLVLVRNTSTVPIPGFDLYISGLPASVSVWNAASDDKLPYALPGTADTKAEPKFKTPEYRLHYGAPLSAGASTTVVVQFFCKARPLPKLNPEFTTVIVESDIPLKGNYGVPVLKVTKVPGKGNLVEFASTVGGSYRLWYTANLRNTSVVPVPSGPWYAVPSLIKATGSKTLWMDQGPPATISSPLEDPRREYRVELTR